MKFDLLYHLISPVTGKLKILLNLGNGLLKTTNDGELSIATPDVDFATSTTLEQIKSDTELYKTEAQIASSSATTAASTATTAASTATTAATGAATSAIQAGSSAATATGAAISAAASAQSASDSANSAADSAAQAVQNIPTFNYPLLKTTNTLSCLYDNLTIGLDASNRLKVISGSSQWTTSGSNIYYNVTGGGVGIGTATPSSSYKLDVNGNINCAEIYRSGTSLATTLGTKQDTLTAGTSLLGIGTSITALNATNITSGTLSTAYGGTGVTTGLTVLNPANLSSAVTVDKGGTGATTLTSGQLLIGNGTTAVLQSANLIWDNVNNRLGVGISNISSNYNLFVSKNSAIGAIVLDRSSYDHTLSPLTLTNQIATSTTVLNDPQPILNLSRQGTSGQAFGARATFKLCRYENNSANSRTRLDVNLAHNGYDDINIMSLRSDGNIGIGTATPSQKLHINSGCLYITNNVTNPGNNTSASFWNQAGIGPTISGDSFSIQTNGTTERMRINNAGNVGIGITNPNCRLYISSNISTVSSVFVMRLACGAYADTNTNATILGLGSEANGWSKCGIAHVRTGAYDQGDIVFLNRNTIDTADCSLTYERMRITSGGNVGIGTNNPYTLLHVKGTNPSLTIMGQGNSGATSQLNLSTYDTLTNTPNCSLIATDSGDFGATFKINLKTSGAIGNSQFTPFSIDKTGNISCSGNIDCAGGISINGSNAFYYAADFVDAGNKINTYINFKDAGATTDWCYLRQIGISNTYKLALDFHDDGNDARFCIRNVNSVNNPDTITEVFTVDNGNVTCTGTKTASKYYVNGEDYSFNSNWNGTGAAGWFVSLNQYWYTGHAYLTVAIYAKNVAGSNAYCWFGRVFCSVNTSGTGTPPANNGGIIQIITDYRNPTTSAVNNNFINVKEKWDGNGNNMLWIEINNFNFAGTMHVKIYG